jgi:hypothetical protein
MQMARFIGRRPIEIIARYNPDVTAHQSIDELTAGRAALEAGDWKQAQQAFERALAIEETPESLEGLGLAAWWLDLAAVVFDARERAYRAYRKRGDHLSAARMAVWIAWDSAAFRGEEGVANGWLERARRLLDGHPDSPEHAFLAARAAVFTLLDDGDPVEAASLAAEAIRAFVELNEWQIEGIKDGIAAADAGRVAPRTRGGRPARTRRSERGDSRRRVERPADDQPPAAA